ncbi:hypothetical protein I6L73_11970 [Klebsiella quasipneumoniae]|uniref:hypothetical protein n=1 Tax=Klebsiella quasipneumoniae TaxID=1463165 RepID=UPI00109C1DF6|nr:hypothetical protein [Klebsiella quasipneumoniae]QXA85558.1 hypothetical protein I6L73_11970 [Klebsiella quasipneumoniae]UDC11237.1 hypothetical protein LGM28_12975 [Klebsiella quasipneumoniae subsp. similipneumoniae]VGP19944.1 hypothetical protein SB04697_02565 [Klebsiella quasipneumoniae subsp. similipneumoniae]
MNIDDLKGIILYKYFNQLQFAEDFCNGHLRLGTLHGYKKCEDDLRGDKGEGDFTFKEFTKIVNGSPSEEEAQILQRFGIGYSHVEDVQISMKPTFMSTSDRWVLCTATQQLDKKEREIFGEYCININAHDLLSGIIEGIQKHYKFYKINFDYVKYADRIAEHTEVLNIEPAFIKPAYPFGNQHEFRFTILAGNNLIPRNGIAHIDKDEYEPIFIDSEIIAKSCNKAY